MRLDAGNAEGGRVASGRRQLNGNAFLDSSFHRLPGDPLVVFCRIFSYFVALFWRVPGRGRLQTAGRSEPIIVRGRFLRGFWARAGVKHGFGQGDGGIPAFETEFAKHLKGQATNEQIPGVSSGGRDSVLVHRFEMPGRLVHTLFKVT